MIDDDEHRARHVALHRAFDELLADFLAHHPDALPSETSVLELVQWSAEQVIKPTPNAQSQK